MSQPKQCPLHKLEDSLCKQCVDEIFARVMVAVLRAETRTVSTIGETDGIIRTSEIQEILSKELRRVQ